MKSSDLLCARVLFADLLCFYDLSVFKRYRGEPNL